MKYAELITIVIRTISGNTQSYAIEMPKHGVLTIQPRMQFVGKYFEFTTKPYTNALVHDPNGCDSRFRDHYLPGVVVSMRSAEIQIG